MTKPNLINYSEWMAELKRLQDEVPEARGLTVTELVEQYGMSKEWVCAKVLKPMMARGELVVTKRKSRRLDGQACWIPEYSIRKGSNGKAKAG